MQYTSTGGGVVVVSPTVGVDPTPPLADPGLRISPNPTAFTATISFRVPERASGRLAIYDLQGRVVLVLKDGIFEAGVQSESWNGRDVAGAKLNPGIYLVRLRMGTTTLTQRLVVVS